MAFATGEGERDNDLEGLRDTYLEPASDGLRLLLRDSTLRLRVLLRLLLPLLFLLFVLSRSLSSSIAASKRLLRGPSSPFSSRTCLLGKRGIIMSQTLSSVNNS